MAVHIPRMSRMPSSFRRSPKNFWWCSLWQPISIINNYQPVNVWINKLSLLIINNHLLVVNKYLLISVHWLIITNDYKVRVHYSMFIVTIGSPSTIFNHKSSFHLLMPIIYQYQLMLTSLWAVRARDVASSKWLLWYLPMTMIYTSPLLTTICYINKPLVDDWWYLPMTTIPMSYLWLITKSN